MRQTLINGRWPITLPDHRADFHDARPWWEAARLADMYATLKPGMRLLDVGSEEGDLTALYANWGAQVSWIDPSIPWVAQTRHILNANGHQVTREHIAALADDHDQTGTGVEQARFVTMDEQGVQRITLDRWATISFVPYVVTMDVEGAELSVLRGATNLLNADTLWWISIHGDVDPHASMPSPVHEYMRGFGYKDQFLAYDHEWHYRFYR